MQLHRHDGSADLEDRRRVGTWFFDSRWNGRVRAIPEAACHSLDADSRSD